MVKKLTQNEFREIYSKVPRLCVDLVIQSSEGVLLTLREIEPGKGFWHFPGGTVLKDEPLEEAVKRVSKAELGVEAEIKRFLAPIEFFSIPFTNGHAVSLAYLVELKDLEFTLDYQSSDARFFKVPPGNTIKEHKEFIEKFLNIA